MNTGSESPQSLSTVGYYKGFSVTITKRDSEAKIMPLIDDAMLAIDYMITKGFLPSWNSDTNKAIIKPVATTSAPVTDDLTSTCPIHNVPMQQRTWTDPKGEVKTWWSHSKQEDGSWLNCSGKGWKENVKKA